MLCMKSVTWQVLCPKVIIVWNRVSVFPKNTVVELNKPGG